MRPNDFTRDVKTPGNTKHGVDQTPANLKPAAYRLDIPGVRAQWIVPTSGNPPPQFQSQTPGYEQPSYVQQVHFPRNPDDACQEHRKRPREENSKDNNPALRQKHNEVTERAAPIVVPQYEPEFRNLVRSLSKLEFRPNCVKGVISSKNWNDAVTYVGTLIDPRPLRAKVHELKKNNPNESRTLALLSLFNRARVDVDWLKNNVPETFPIELQSLKEELLLFWRGTPMLSAASLWLIHRFSPPAEKDDPSTLVERILKLAPPTTETVRRLAKLPFTEVTTLLAQPLWKGTQLSDLAVKLDAAEIHPEAGLVAILSLLSRSSLSKVEEQSLKLLQKEFPQEFPKEWSHLLPDLLEKFPQLPYTLPYPPFAPVQNVEDRTHEENYTRDNDPALGRQTHEQVTDQAPIDLVPRHGLAMVSGSNAVRMQIQRSGPGNQRPSSSHPVLG